MSASVRIRELRPTGNDAEDALVVSIVDALGLYPIDGIDVRVAFRSNCTRIHFLGIIDGGIDATETT